LKLQEDSNRTAGLRTRNERGTFGMLTIDRSLDIKCSVFSNPERAFCYGYSEHL